MIIKSEFNEDGRDLQEVIEQFLVEFYYEYYELDLLWIKKQGKKLPNKYIILSRLYILP